MEELTPASMQVSPAARDVNERTPWLLGVAVAAVSMVQTRDGILMDPDSSAYLWTARQLRAEPGSLFDLPTGTALSIRYFFPPGYSLVLALLGTIGDDLAGARVLGAMLAGLCAASLYRIVASVAGALTAFVAVALVFTSRGFLLVAFGFLLSDGLHLALAIATVAAILPAVRSRELPARHVGSLIASPVAAAAAFLTRYVGLGIVIGLAVVALTLVDPSSPRVKRVRRAATLATAAATPTIAWLILLAASGPGERRHLGFRPIRDLEVVEQIPGLFLPKAAIDLLGVAGIRVLAVAAAALIVGWSALVLRRPHTDPRTRTAAVLLVFGWGSLVTLLVARLFFDRQIPLSGRYFLPFVAFVIPALALDAHRRLQDLQIPEARRRALRLAPIVLLLGAAPAFVRSVWNPTESWFNLAQVPPSSLARRAATLPDHIVVVTNREDFVYLQTRRTTAFIPEEIDVFTGEPRPTYPDELAALASRVRRGDAIIVQYRRDAGGVAPIEQLVERTGLLVLHDDPEGVIVGVPDQLPPGPAN